MNKIVMWTWSKPSEPTSQVKPAPSVWCVLSFGRSLTAQEQAGLSNWYVNGDYQMRSRWMALQDEELVPNIPKRGRPQQCIRRVSGAMIKVRGGTPWLHKSFPGKWKNAWQCLLAFLHSKFSKSKDSNSEQKEIKTFHSFFVMPQHMCPGT